MLGSDIFLDFTGNTIIQHGDFKKEVESDLSYLNRMLIYPPGSWSMHPSLGIGLRSFIMGTTVDDNINRLENTIDSVVTGIGLLGSTSVNKNEDTLDVKIQIFDPQGTNRDILDFSFNYMNGNLTYNTNSKEEEQTITSSLTTIHIKSKNKYRDRR